MFIYHGANTKQLKNYLRKYINVNNNKIMMNSFMTTVGNEIIYKKNFHVEKRIFFKNIG